MESTLSMLGNFVGVSIRVFAATASAGVMTVRLERPISPKTDSRASTRSVNLDGDIDAGAPDRYQQ